MKRNELKIQFQLHLFTKAISWTSDSVGGIRGRKQLKENSFLISLEPPPCFARPLSLVPRPSAIQQDKTPSRSPPRPMSAHKRRWRNGGIRFSLPRFPAQLSRRNLVKLASFRRQTLSRGRSLPRSSSSSTPTRIFYPKFN